MGNLIRLVVDTTVRLNHEVEGFAVEVRDVRSNRVLAAKFETLVSSSAQRCPELPLDAAWRASLFAAVQQATVFKESIIVHDGDDDTSARASARQWFSLISHAFRVPASPKGEAGRAPANAKRPGVAARPLHPPMPPACYSRNRIWSVQKRSSLSSAAFSFSKSPDGMPPMFSTVRTCFS
jgi:hypothetical protein